MSQDQHPGTEGDFLVTFFLVVSDQDRSRNFYQSVFGGKVLRERDPVILEVANATLILNDGGGPTDDKPTVTLTTPPDPDQVSAFLNVRVTDIATASKTWPARGAGFLTESKTTAARSAHTSATPTATSSRSARPSPRQARKAVSSRPDGELRTCARWRQAKPCRPARYACASRRGEFLPRRIIQLTPLAEAEYVQDNPDHRRQQRLRP